jgi:glycosyltransferase involved in cell wall biosynthesis
MKPRIYHVGLSIDEQKSLVKSLQNYSSEYLSVDWTKIKDIKNKIISDVNNFLPDFIFVQIQRDVPEIIESFKYICTNYSNIKIFNWMGDVTNPFQTWFIDFAKISNNIYTGFSDKDQMENLIVNGIKQSYHIQIGCEDWMFNKDIQPDIINGNDIVFAGALYPHLPLGNFRIEIVDYLKSIYEDKFSVYGNGWGTKSFSYFDTAKIIKGSKIIVGINNWECKHYTSNRMFNTMAVGTLYFANYYEGIEEDFENKKHLVWWSTKEELKELIDYYLEHDDERKKIALAGMKEVKKNHTWYSRIKQIFEIVNINKDE